MPVADTVAPALAALTVRPSSFKAKSSGPTIVTSGGATVTFRLSEGATVTFTVHRIEQGRKRGRTCQRSSSSNRRGTPCNRYVKVAGSFRDSDSATGANSLRFSGRLGGRELSPGRYRLTAVATDGAGNAGAARTATFRIRR